MEAHARRSSAAGLGVGDGDDVVERDGLSGTALGDAVLVPLMVPLMVIVVVPLIVIVPLDVIVPLMVDVPLDVSVRVPLCEVE